MHVHIDISLIAATSAIGRISGALDFPVLPRVGELVSLERAVQAEAGFSGQLVVEHVIHTSSHDRGEPMLVLGDVVSPTLAHALSIASALESSYGLVFEQYERLD